MLVPIGRHLLAAPGFTERIASLHADYLFRCFDELQRFAHHAGTVRCVEASAGDSHHSQPCGELLSCGRSRLSKSCSVVRRVVLQSLLRSGLLLQLLLLRHLLRLLLLRWATTW